jgi:hypothetical protein
MSQLKLWEHTESLKHYLLGQFPLTVGKYKNRVKGLLRGRDATGVRLDCHHVPHDGTSYIERESGIVVAIPEDVHSWLHKVRDRAARNEELKQQVENDYDFIRGIMKKRGYSDELIDESLQLVHHGNEHASYRNPYTGQRVTVNLYKNERGK